MLLFSSNKTLIWHTSRVKSGIDLYVFNVSFKADFMLKSCLVSEILDFSENHKT